MTEQEKNIALMLASGIEPSAEELGQALASVMEERDMFEAMTKDMGKVLSELIFAHLYRDAAGLFDVLNDFIKNHVKIAKKSDESVH
jgi:hypothetical protein